MSSRTVTDLSAARAHASGPAHEAVASLISELKAGLGVHPAAAVLYFASSAYEPRELAGPLTAAFPHAMVVGCSTAGEFTDREYGRDGISAVALPTGVVTRAAAALGVLSGSAGTGTEDAVRAVEAQLGRPLRDLDPDRHLGIVLVEGLHAVEESVNQRLSQLAPGLDLIGGSAADDLVLRGTWVAVGERVSYQGLALLVLATGVPFWVVKTCSFRPTGRTLRVTRADLANRVALELNGRPAAEAYAEAVGLPVSELGPEVWIQQPVGLMIGGEPWVRSIREVDPDGGLVFHSQVLEGMELELMTPGDLIGDTARAVGEARRRLGGEVSGAVWFNCVQRRLQLDGEGQAEQFLAALGGIPAAGFHTYGETWLGHLNQTLTGVVFG